MRKPISVLVVVLGLCWGLTGVVMALDFTLYIRTVQSDEITPFPFATGKAAVKNIEETDKDRKRFDTDEYGLARVPFSLETSTPIARYEIHAEGTGGSYCTGYAEGYVVLVDSPSVNVIMNCE